MGMTRLLFEQGVNNNSRFSGCETRSYEWRAEKVIRSAVETLGFINIHHLALHCERRS